MTGSDPAARAQRERFTQALGLPQPGLFVRVALQRGVALERGADRRVADGDARDLRRCRQVAIEQRRLDAKRVGVGVEPVGLRIGRQHRRGIDLDAEQVAHGVGVLGAIEAMEARRPTGIRARRGGAVQLASPTTWQRRHTSRCRAAACSSGGIDRLRSCTTTFSQVSDEFATWSASALSSSRFAVFNRSL